MHDPMFTPLTIANLVVCLAGGYLCICRLRIMRASMTKKSVRVQYSIWFALFVSSALSFTYGEPPTWTQLVLTAFTLLVLLIGSAAWSAGPPRYTMRGVKP